MLRDGDRSYVGGHLEAGLLERELERRLELRLAVAALFDLREERAVRLVAVAATEAVFAGPARLAHLLHGEADTVALGVDVEHTHAHLLPRCSTFSSSSYDSSRHGQIP